MPTPATTPTAGTPFCGALTDTRGARGRARAVRDAARDGADVQEAVLAGWRPVHRDQLELFTPPAGT